MRSDEKRLGYDIFSKTNCSMMDIQNQQNAFSYPLVYHNIQEGIFMLLGCVVKMKEQPFHTM